MVFEELWKIMKIKSPYLIPWYVQWIFTCFSFFYITKVFNINRKEKKGEFRAAISSQEKEKSELELSGFLHLDIQIWMFGFLHLNYLHSAD